MSEADRRYWRRADVRASYDDSAFTKVLSEQDGVHFRLSEPILRTSSVLFLVGEAGLGKSHSLAAEQRDLQAAGQVCLRIDAEAVGSIGDLRELTEPPPNHLGVTWWHIDHLERATNPRQFLLCWDEPGAIAVAERWLLALDLELRTRAAIALVRIQPSQLSPLWPRFRDDKSRALAMLAKVVGLLELVGSSNRFRRQLPESVLGELFIWLERHGSRPRSTRCVRS